MIMPRSDRRCLLVEFLEDASLWIYAIGRQEAGTLRMFLFIMNLKYQQDNKIS
jgi:hypothetical protein